MMNTILITNDAAIVADAEAAGVTRIMVDLETMGKKERQASRATFISAHVREDVSKVRAVLKKAGLIVRINPWHAKSKAEIDHAVESGAGIIMLPMITNLAQMEAALAHIAGRVKLLPLVETAYSMAHIADIAEHPAIDELYIGLNDLHLSLGLDFLFEPLALGLLDWMAEKIKPTGKPFGFGGIAMIGSGELPAERILGEHVRLGSTCVILSSRFCKDVNITDSKGRRQRLSDALALFHQTYEVLGRRDEFRQKIDGMQTATQIKGMALAMRRPA